MWDPLYTEWIGLPVEEENSCIHIHWHGLSAVTHHLHLDSKEPWPYVLIGAWWACVYPRNVCCTWKEWTGSCREWFFTEGTQAGAGSGGGGGGCTARLWLVTASWSAFSTLKEQKLPDVILPKCGVSFTPGRGNVQAGNCVPNEHHFKCLSSVSSQTYTVYIQTFFSSDERRLTNAEILHNKWSISISGPLFKTDQIKNWNMSWSVCWCRSWTV